MQPPLSANTPVKSSQQACVSTLLYYRHPIFYYTYTAEYYSHSHGVVLSASYRIPEPFNGVLRSFVSSSRVQSVESPSFSFLPTPTLLGVLQTPSPYSLSPTELFRLSHTACPRWVHTTKHGTARPHTTSSSNPPTLQSIKMSDLHPYNVHVQLIAIQCTRSTHHWEFLSSNMYKSVHHRHTSQRSRSNVQTSTVFMPHHAS